MAAVAASGPMATALHGLPASAYLPPAGPMIKRQLGLPACKAVPHGVRCRPNPSSQGRNPKGSQWGNTKPGEAVSPSGEAVTTRAPPPRGPCRAQ